MTVPTHVCLLSFLFACLITQARASDAASQCIDCHSKTTPNIVSDWKLSKHSGVDVNCVTCHGDAGKGDGQNASNLNPPVPDLTTSKNLADATYVRRVIAEGSAAVGRSPLSPPWGRSLRPQEIEYLSSYCRSLASKKR